MRRCSRRCSNGRWSSRSWGLRSIEPPPDTARRSWCSARPASARPAWSRRFLATSAPTCPRARGRLRGPAHPTRARAAPRRGPVAPAGPLAEALAARPDSDLVFAAVAEELASPAVPTVLVVEDAHWADSATLDVLRYVGRRVHDLPAVLVVTYRDDELGRDHPLRGVLGGLGRRGRHPAAAGAA